MANINVITGTAIIIDPNDATKRIAKGETWTLNVGGTDIAVTASTRAIAHSYSTKEQFTIVTIDTDTIDSSGDKILQISSTSGTTFKPV